MTGKYMQHSDLDSKRIAVLLSGGVDSSVVVYEFANLGLHPDCFYIKIGPEDDKEWDCSSEEDLEMATAVAHKYGCNLEVIDCHREYWDQVTRYTMEKVRAGFTPNPDVMCNRLIKFGAFDDKRGHDYDLIATGHYAQTEIDEAGRKWLVTSPDPVKDQTDFLAQIYDWQLRKAIFPIGHYVKDEVRLIAEREHLVNAKRKDSQGICFLGKINYNDYIRRYLGENPGDVIELETGRRIGEHKGLTDLIKEYAKDGKLLAAICAAPTVFGQLGILEGKKATCYPGLEDKLLGADVITDERVVTDGNITTSRGVGTAISFALRLIAILKDEATANRVKRGIVYGHQ